MTTEVKTDLDAETIPKLRSTIWAASLTCSLICSAATLSLSLVMSRAGDDSVRAEFRQTHMTQTQHVSIPAPKNREDVIQEEMARIRTQRELVKGM